MLSDGWCGLWGYLKVVWLRGCGVLEVRWCVAVLVVLGDLVAGCASWGVVICSAGVVRVGCWDRELAGVLLLGLGRSWGVEFSALCVLRGYVSCHEGVLVILVLFCVCSGGGPAWLVLDFGHLTRRGAAAFPFWR